MRTPTALLAAFLLAACNTSFDKSDAGDADGTDSPDTATEDSIEEPEADLPPPDDSDGDTISDEDEGAPTVDTDGDTTPDFEDEDSDADTIPDAVEAGDDDVWTPPVDTDDDGTPDFRDLDSDNDGLGDRWEHEHGLDPLDEDTDDDGAPDLIEVGAGTDPLDGSSNPASEGNFFFLVPYMEDPDPGMDTLVFSTDLQKADVFFLMDTTGSMSGAMDNLRTSLSSIIIPAVRTAIPDVMFGVGRFDDYPVGSFGGGPDVVFELMQRMTSSSSEAQDAVNALDLHWGSDMPESHVPALYATATGSRLGLFLPPQGSCATEEFGYPCFREDSLPIVVMFTDAEFHNGPGGVNPYSGIIPAPPTYDETVTALTTLHMNVITIVNDAGYGGLAIEHCRQVTTDTGTVDSTGSPVLYVIPHDGTGLGTEVVNGIETLAEQVPIGVLAVTRDDPTDPVDATRFIGSVVPNTVGGVEDPTDPGTFCIGGLEVADITGDTVPDAFTEVLPGTTICFDVTAVRNEIVPATSDPQVFKAFIDVLGDGITVLDTRQVFFLVPPEI